MRSFIIKKRNMLREYYCFSYFEVRQDNVSNLREVFLFFGTYVDDFNYDIAFSEDNVLYFIIKGADVIRVNKEGISSSYQKVNFDILVNEIRSLNVYD